MLRKIYYSEVFIDVIDAKTKRLLRKDKFMSVVKPELDGDITSNEVLIKRASRIPAYQGNKYCIKITGVNHIKCLGEESSQAATKKIKRNEK